MSQQTNENRLMDVWYVDDNSLNEFICRGGKIIYIAEEIPPQLKNNPFILSAGILLPTIDSIQLYLDGFYDQFMMSYENYLLTEEADKFIAIIIAAAFQRVPVGLMFGQDEKNMKIPEVFIHFLYKFYGLFVMNRTEFITGMNPGYSFIDDNFVPVDLAKLYIMNLIDFRMFMEAHTSAPIIQDCVWKMVYELNPIVESRTFENYYMYFNSYKDAVYNNNHKFLIDPMRSVL